MGKPWIAGLAALVACMLAVAVAVASGTWSVARTNIFGSVAEAQANPADATQALAERLLSPALPGPDGRAWTTQLLVGHWPSGLPLDLPVPPGGHLVGSSLRTAGGSVMSVDGVLDVNGAVADILAFYSRELGARGWTPVPSFSPPGVMRGGFQPASSSSSAQTFCKGTSGPWVSVQVGAREGTPSDVRVHVNPSQPGPCAIQAGPQPPGSPFSDLLPPLVAPTGVPIQMQGGGTGQARVTSEAVAETDQAPAELEAHFARQLQAAGWQRLQGGVNGPMAWSTWRPPRDGDWQGLLFVLEGPGQRRRALYARVESANQSGSAWMTGSVSISASGPSVSSASAVSVNSVSGAGGSISRVPSPLPPPPTAPAGR